MSENTDYTERARELFGKDRYGTDLTGIYLEEARKNYARCTLEIEDKHLNINDYVMGGVICTLIDYTFGVASNAEENNTITLSAAINYVTSTKGPKLFCEATCTKDGRKICFYNVVLTDSSGKTVATAEVNGYKTK